MENSHQGYIVRVRGSVVDVFFAEKLPPPQTELHVDLPGSDGRTCIMEVMAHLSRQDLRAVALTPSRGLAKGHGGDKYRPFAADPGR